MELLPAWTTAGSWSLGRDPLGMQATSVRLYRNLVPGLTMSDGVVSDGRIAVYTYTNPRLLNLIRFLRDANLHDGQTVTQAGTRFLDASQPI
jgi:hypothetical protein